MSSLTVRVLALCTASGTSGSEPKRAPADRGTLQKVGCHHAFMPGDPGLFVCTGTWVRARPVPGGMLVAFAFWIMLDPVAGDLLPFMGPIVTVLGANCILVAGLMWGLGRGLVTRWLGERPSRSAAHCQRSG